MAWTPRTTKTQNGNNAGGNPKFTHFGSCNEAGTGVLVYGPKPHEKAREPQSKRAFNSETFEMMIRGCLGIGEPGINALRPLVGRKTVDLECFLEEGCPYKGEFTQALEKVKVEAQGADVELLHWMVVQDEERVGVDEE